MWEDYEIIYHVLFYLILCIQNLRRLQDNISCFIFALFYMYRIFKDYKIIYHVLFLLNFICIESSKITR